MGYGGNDVIGGQGGNDLIVTGEPDGADLISGGPGVDTVSYSDSNGARAAGVHVTLDNSANDGASGEGDNVRSDVENVTGTSGPDVLAGDTAPNRLNGLGGHDRLLGESGNDTIEAQDGVADLVDGGPGTDRAFLDCGLDRFTNVEGRIC